MVRNKTGTLILMDLFVSCKITEKDGIVLIGILSPVKHYEFNEI